MGGDIIGLAISVNIALLATNSVLLGVVVCFTWPRKKVLGKNYLPANSTQEQQARKAGFESLGSSIIGSVPNDHKYAIRHMTPEYEADQEERIRAKQ